MNIVLVLVDQGHNIEKIYEVYLKVCLDEIVQTNTSKLSMHNKQGIKGSNTSHR